MVGKNRLGYEEREDGTHQCIHKKSTSQPVHASRNLLNQSRPTFSPRALETEGEPRYMSGFKDLVGCIYFFQPVTASATEMQVPPAPSLSHVSHFPSSHHRHLSHISTGYSRAVIRLPKPQQMRRIALPHPHRIFHIRRPPLRILGPQRVQAGDEFVVCTRIDAGTVPVVDPGDVAALVEEVLDELGFVVGDAAPRGRVVGG